MNTHKHNPSLRAAPVAYRLQYNGGGLYSFALSESDYSVVFEEDDGTGYLYVTNKSQSDIYDALHIYNVGDQEHANVSLEAYVVWDAISEKLGFFAGDRFLAIVDFKNRRSYCRSDFPGKVGSWGGEHTWIVGVEQELLPH